MSWYATGEEGKKRAKKAEEEAASYGDQVYRFSMRPGEEKELIFLSDDPFYIYEHGVWVEDMGPNGRLLPFTCTNGGEPCVLCERKFRSYYAGIFTVLELRDWSDKDGVEHKYSKKLLVAKVGKNSNMVSVLLRKGLRRKEQGGAGLVMSKFVVARTQKKAPRIGDDYDFVADMSAQRAEILEDAKDIAVYDYMKILAPKSREEIKGILEGYKTSDGLIWNGPRSGSSGGSSSGSATDSGIDY